ncbi:MAG: AI-2E family transporter [Vicinamibacteria bacterium]
MNLTLTERQTRTVAVAVTIISVLVILAAVGGVFWLVAWFLRSFSNVFLPLAVGAVAALVFRPYYEWLCQKLHLPGSLALVLVFLSMLVPVGAFLWFFGSLIVGQLVDLVAQIPEWSRGIWEYVRGRWPQVEAFLTTHPAGQRLREVLESQGDTLVQGLQIFGQGALSAGAGLLRGIGSIFTWAVLPVYFAFFLMAKPGSLDSAQLLPFLKPETRKDVTYLVHEFVDIVVAFFRGQLIIAFLQGILFALGFSLAGLKYGFVVGLALGFLNVIPYLGSILGLSVALPLAFFQTGGGSRTLVAVAVVFVVVQLIEGYVLTPKIMGKRTGLHFMAIIVAIFFWGAALGGIFGLILAIPLTAFLASLWRLAKEKYIPELV